LVKNLGTLDLTEVKVADLVGQLRSPVLPILCKVETSVDAADAHVFNEGIILVDIAVLK